MNGTDKGEYVMYTGRKDKSKLAQIHTWNGSRYQNTWPGERCDKLEGATEGLMYPTPVHRDTEIAVFIRDICRAHRLRVTGEVEVRGFRGYRFQVPFREVADAKINTNNSCFCLTPDTCLGSALIDVSPCYYGAPLVLSFPHFYWADKEHLQKVTGLKPQRALHETFLDINMVSGTLLSMRRCIQVNLNIKGFETMGYLANIPELLFPIVWLEESVSIDRNVAEFFYMFLVLPIQVATALGYFLLAVLFLLTLSNVMYQKLKHGTNKLYLMLTTNRLPY
jgi:lysosome membrane protein 2